jgi:KEOPS complex subunit Pcc1
VGAVDDGRAETAVAQDAGTLTVEIEAEDLHALRAAMNSWSRLISTARAVVG